MPSFKKVYKIGLLTFGEIESFRYREEDLTQGVIKLRPFLCLKG